MQLRNHCRHIQPARYSLFFVGGLGRREGGSRVASVFFSASLRIAGGQAGLSSACANRAAMAVLGEAPSPGLMFPLSRVSKFDTDARDTYTFAWDFQGLASAVRNRQYFEIPGFHTIGLNCKVSGMRSPVHGHDSH